MESTDWAGRFRLMLGANWVVSIACQIAIIVVIATVVRRQRPDAWKTIFAWSIAVGAMWLWSPIARVLFQAAGDSAGIDNFYRGQVLAQVVSIPLHVGIVVLLIRELIKLAQPPPPPVLPHEPPYR